MSCVGIVGGGQLARMLALSGIPLDLNFVILDPAADACAASLGIHLNGAYDDHTHFQQLARCADVVTYEFENVPETSMEYLASHVPVYPNAAALATARDRLCEKRLFTELAIPTAPHAAVNSLSDLERAAAKAGFPAILKTRTLGYDGKGQKVLQGAEDLGPAWSELGGVPLILEAMVQFDREVSCIAVRARNGETAFYPLAENLHREGILRVSWSRPGDAMTLQMQGYARRVLERLDYVGVLTIEFFQAGDVLLANEMAPRVHNSGHWTIEGAQTSQFENHLRAILGLPLGETDPVGHVAMINCIGRMPGREAVLAIPGAHLHRYGKAFSPGRKVGHITVRSENRTELEAQVNRVLRLVEPELADAISFNARSMPVRSGPSHIRRGKVPLFWT